MRVLNHVWLRKQVPVFLPKCQSIIVLKFVSLRWDILRPRLSLLLSLCQGNLALRHIRNALDRYDTASLSKLAYRGHLSRLKCHSASKLERSVLACYRAQLCVAMLASSLLSDGLVRDCFVGLFNLRHKLVDWVLLVTSPSWHFS